MTIERANLLLMLLHCRIIPFTKKGHYTSGAAKRDEIN